MYGNEKMIPVETVPGIRRGGMGESSGGGEFKYDRFDILQETCKCYNVPISRSTTIKKNVWIIVLHMKFRTIKL
jgi:hypothetical protein